MKDIFGDKSNITRIDSPRLVKEKKSKDFDTTSVRSPRLTRRERGIQKTYFDNNTQCWSIKYEVEDQDFAKGAYGKILLAKDKVTGDRVVIKKIPTTTPIRMINNEVKAGKIIGAHPNIPALLQYVDKPDFHFLVFQFVNGKDLFCYLESLEFSPRPESEARSIISDVFNALHHIHSQKIAHRDIKLENILLDTNGKAFVVDMGLCAFMEEGKLNREWCGSDNYLAPEIVRRNPYNAYKADIFSCGVVLFALVYGVFPFDNLRVNGGGYNFGNPLKKLQVRFPTDVNASEAVKDLLWRMLEDDPENRIELKDILTHPWVTNSKQAKNFVVEEKFNIKDISCEAVTFLM